MSEVMCSVNGVNVYSLLNNNLNCFCLALYIRAGSLFENESNNGISHLFEHVVFRNLKHKYNNFYELLALHGIELHGCTYKEFIRFSINGPSSEFHFALEILCSLFDEINLPKCELDKEKKRIKAEMRENDERSSLDYYFNKVVWKDTEAEKSLFGYCRVLDRISINKLNEFRKEIFAKDNFFIYVTGNVAANDFNTLKEKIGSLEIQQDTIARQNIVSESEEFFNRACIVNIKDDYWHYIKIGFDIDCSKYSNGVLDLLYDVLFKGDIALVYNCLSEDNSIIYSYDSTLEQYDNIGNISFKFQVDKNNVVAAVNIIVKLLNDIKHGDFSFGANLTSQMFDLKMLLDKPDDLNWNMAYYNHILRTQPIDYSDKHYGRLAVTKDQVINTAREVFKVKNMTIVIKGDKKKIKTEDIENILKALDE